MALGCQLLALSRGRTLVGNGFIRSACTDFAGTETNVVGAIIDRPILIMFLPDGK